MFDGGMSVPQVPSTITVEMDEKKTLLSIPQEMLEAVAKEAESHDLLSLRLVSRAISRASDRPFVHEFFTDRNHLLTVDSLRDLIQITATPHFCKGLQKLTLSMPWLGRGYQVKEEASRACFPHCTNEEHKVKNAGRPKCAVWAAWKQEKRQLENGMEEMLMQALRNIASTQRSHHLDLRLDAKIERDGRIHGRVKFASYLNAPITPDNYGKVPLIDRVGSTTSCILLRTIPDSCVALQELHLPRGCFPNDDDRRRELRPARYLDWSSNFYPKVGLSLSNVHTIDFGDYMHRCLPPIHNQNLPDLMADWFPALTNISITSKTDIPRLTAAFPPGKFKAISHQGEYYYDSIQEVKPLLAHHRDSLRHVSLYNATFSFRYERNTDKLQYFMEWISGELKLQTFQFRAPGYELNDAISIDWHEDVGMKPSECGYLDGSYFY